MKNAITLIAILVVMIACAGRTGISKHFPHPQDDSIQYHVACWANGEYGKAFSDYGTKESGITIWDKEYVSRLHESKFTIEGGSISWKCREMTNDGFVIEIYDCKTYSVTEGARLYKEVYYKKTQHGWGTKSMEWPNKSMHRSP